MNSIMSLWTVDTKDTTQCLQTKIQGKLCELHKKGKLDQATYKSIKAHKPEKQYPARLITSHIRAPHQT